MMTEERLEAIEACYGHDSFAHSISVGHVKELIGEVRAAWEHTAKLRAEIAAKDKTIRDKNRRIGLFVTKIPIGYFDRYVLPHMAALEREEEGQ